MTDLQIGVFGFGVLGILIYAGMHISTALLIVAFCGVWLIRGDIGIAGNLLAIAATDAVAEYEFGTVPLFVLMGFLVMVAGVGTDSYTVAHRLLRRVPGGLGTPPSSATRSSRRSRALPWQRSCCSRGLRSPKC